MNHLAKNVMHVIVTITALILLMGVKKHTDIFMIQEHHHQK